MMIVTKEEWLLLVARESELWNRALQDPRCAELVPKLKALFDLEKEDAYPACAALVQLLACFMRGAGLHSSHIEIHASLAAAFGVESRLTVERGECAACGTDTQNPKEPQTNA